MESFDETYEHIISLQRKLDDVQAGDIQPLDEKLPKELATQ